MFTSIARVVSVLIFLVGLARAAIGLAIASGSIIEPEPGAYLGNSTTGEAIDRGILYMLIAVFLGVLAEISHSLRKARTHEATTSTPETAETTLKMPQ